MRILMVFHTFPVEFVSIGLESTTYRPTFHTFHSSARQGIMGSALCRGEKPAVHACRFPMYVIKVSAGRGKKWADSPDFRLRI